MRNQFPTNRVGGILAGLATVAASVSLPASATLLIQEQFQYSSSSAPAGEFNTRNGGTGWGGAWTASTLNSQLQSSLVAGNSSLVSPLIVTGGPLPPNNNRAEIGRTGGTVNSPSVANRAVGTPLNGTVGAGGSTLFVSFLLRQTSGTLNADDQAYLWLGNATSGASSGTFAKLGLVGADATPMGIIVGSGGSSPTTAELSSSSFAANQTYLFLARLSKIGDTSATGGWDKIEYWIDPTLDSNCNLPVTPFSQELTGAGQGTITSLTTIGFAGNNLEANDLFQFDDVRVFNDIANLGLDCPPPVPEASTVSMGVAMLGMARMWYFKRNRAEKVSVASL